jgi:hypothetical protein
MAISQYHLSRLLLDEMEHIGLERSFETLTIKELNELAKRLLDRIKKRESTDDEPPF